MEKTMTDITEHIDVLNYVWMGVPFNVPLFEVYAQIPNPVASRIVKYEQQNLHILSLDKYDVPLFEPLGIELDTMPKFAIVLADYQGAHFRLIARPADHIEGVSKVHRLALKSRSTFQPKY
jgi:hypothetical protein